MSNNSLRNFYPEGYTTTTHIVVDSSISQTFVRCNTFTVHKRAVKKVFMAFFVESEIGQYVISAVVYPLVFFAFGML